MTDEIMAFTCDALGVSGTTRVFIRKTADGFEARVGIAIMGSTNMKGEQLERANPFDASFRDNYASGTGTTQHAAVQALEDDLRSISDGLFASVVKCDCGNQDCPRCFKKGGA